MLGYCLAYHDAISPIETPNFQLSISICLDDIYLFDLHQSPVDIQQRLTLSVPKIISGRRKSPTPKLMPIYTEFRSSVMAQLCALPRNTEYR
jgi:hypothetical protein